MKVVIYGASVTAQKGDSGYFDILDEKLKHNEEDLELVRIPFGASHLQFAGIAMIQKVLNVKPDICILDWVTPSTKVFPKNIVERINSILTSNNIKPIWVLFPRADDNLCERECCQQIKKTSSNEIDVFSFQESKYKEENLENILRDTVHTNKNGAQVYSQFMLDIIKNQSKKKPEIKNKNPEEEKIPFIFDSSGVINNNSNLKTTFEVVRRCNISLYLHAKIGPFSPVLKISLKDENGNFLERHCKNVVDPWCYYERNMLLNLPTLKNVNIGYYTLEIELDDKNPFENLETLKPRDFELDKISNLDRYLEIKEISIDGDLKTQGFIYGL